MDRIKSNFRGKRSQHTRAFFRESRNMTEAFPHLFSPERPYVSPVSDEDGPKHVMKLIGSLYDSPQPKRVAIKANQPIDFETQVLTDTVTSTKKVRCASSKAKHTNRAMSFTIEECQ